jgi:hypothetical protein
MIFWIIVFLFFFPSTNESIKESWQVKSISTLKVDGKTNINSFSCNIPSYDRENDVLTFEKSTNGYNVIGKMTIPIVNFDCHNRMMTKDLQKTLKSTQYPEMLILFKNFTHLPSTTNKGSILVGMADIKLAGTTKMYEINFTTLNNQPNEVELLGQRKILFSDFGLTPPSKLGGTIKVKNELEVEFRLLLKRMK